MINYSINLFCNNNQNLSEFLNLFYENKIELSPDSSYEKHFKNPIEMIDLISAIIDNNEKFQIGIWISIDKDIFINVTEENLDKIIRYLYERYPT